MRKISDYRDADALDLLADLLEPFTEIVTDPEVQEAYKASKLRSASVAIKRHKSAVLAILARMDNVPVEDFHCNVFTLPGRVLEVLNDSELIAFFTDAAQTATSNAASGAASATTGETVLKGV